MSDYHRKRSRGYPPVPYVLNRTDDWYTKYTNWGNTVNGQHSLSNYDYNNACDWEIMEDVVHPNYQARKAAGELIIGPLHYEKKQRIVEDGHYVAYESKPPTVVEWNRTGSANWTAVCAETLGYPPNYSIGTPGNSLHTDDYMMMEAVAKVDPSKYALMEDVLELRSSVMSFTEPLKRLDSLSQKWEAARKMYGPTNLWLTYRMAVVPFVNSICDVIEGQEHAWRNLAAGVRLRAKARDEKSAEVVTTCKDVTNHYEYKVQHKRYASKSAGVFYLLKVPRGGWQQTYGLRLKDIPVGFWNIVPLSFMVDRMFNVSAAIRSLVNLADPNISFEGGYISNSTMEYKEWLHVRQYWDSTYTVSTPPIIEKYLLKNRYYKQPESALVSVLAPNLLQDVRISDLVNDANRAADLMALISQRFAR